MKEVLKHWGLEEEPVKLRERSCKSASNEIWEVGNQYILKGYSDKGALQTSIEINKLLLRSQVSVVEYLQTTDGNWKTADGSYCMMKKLPGQHLTFDEVTESIVQELGKELAKLHLSLLKVESETFYQDHDFLSEWYDYIKPGLVNVADDIVDFVEGKLVGLYSLLPRQLIHRDIHFENILFKNDKLTGWLDLDLSRKDIRIFDLAYFLVGQLVGKVEDPRQISKWCLVRDSLLAGYNKVERLSTEEIEILPVLMIAIELLFVTYWQGKGNVREQGKAICLAKWLYENFEMM